ncbi:MAG: ABC transporter substrate-binding protein [Candidatus Hodarchaeales archaeon]
MKILKSFLLLSMVISLVFSTLMIINLDNDQFSLSLSKNEKNSPSPLLIENLRSFINSIINIKGKSAGLQNNNTKTNYYWMTNRGFFDNITFKVINDEVALVESLRNGTIDMIGQFVDTSLLNASDYSNPNISLTQTRRRGYGHITFNAQRFPTNTRALRQGFAYALNKTDLQIQAFNNASYPADSPVVPSVGIWSCEHTLAQCSYPNGTYYDSYPEIANATVLSMGWYDYDGDGWREFFNGTTPSWNGSAVYFNDISGNPNYDGYTQYNVTTFADAAGANGTLSYSDSGLGNLHPDFWNSTLWVEDTSYLFNVTAGTTGSIVANTSIFISEATFQSMGIRAYASFIDFPTLIDNLNSGNFNSAFFGYAGLEPNPLELNKFFSGSSDNQDYHRWYNSTFDSLWDIIDTSSNFTEVLETSYEAQRVLWQEQPLVVMYNNELTSMYRVDNFEDYITIPGVGAFNDISLTKAHLKSSFAYQNPEWPLGGSFNYGLPLSMSSQNTIAYSDTYTITVMDMIEEELFNRNPENLSYMGELAHSWDIESPCSSQDCIDANASNGTKVTFYLMDNVTWHDDTPFTSEDVKFSFQMLKNNQSPVFYDNLLNIQTDNIETPDNFTVIIYSNSSSLFELEKMRVRIYQKSFWNAISDPVNFNTTVPIGTGPYKWVNRTPGVSIELERYDNYYRKPIAANMLDSDLDGMSDYWEMIMGLNSSLNDAGMDKDMDGMPNIWEYQMGLNATLDDSGLDHDSDGMPNLWEYQMGLSAVLDDSTLDLDLDGLTNFEEFQFGSWPNRTDTDLDGMNDLYESQMGLNTTINDSSLDKDLDGMPNLWEYQMGLSALDPSDAFLDKDTDGMSNLWEYQMGLNATLNDAQLDDDADGLTNLEEFQFGSWANRTDTDLDGMNDFYESQMGLNGSFNDANLDLDNDSLLNLAEFLLGSWANQTDTDLDGMNDLYEYQMNLNATLNDTNLDLDNDGLTNLEEYQIGSWANQTDTDSDGINDFYESQMGLNVTFDDAGLDMDSDGLTNLEEYSFGSWANQTDTDSDGMSDLYESQMGLNATLNDAELDEDNDYLTNLEEYTFGSWANQTDTDLDGMIDYYEYLMELNATFNDANLDKDNDSLTNLQEYLFGSWANQTDSDDDSLPDLWEYQMDLNPTLNDANLDKDNDTITNIQEYLYNSNANKLDSDDDQLPDQWEYEYFSHPTSANATDDSDSDGVTNLQEYFDGTNPLVSDTDTSTTSETDTSGPSHVFTETESLINEETIVQLTVFIVLTSAVGFYLKKKLEGQVESAIDEDLFEGDDDDLVERRGKHRKKKTR